MSLFFNIQFTDELRNYFLYSSRFCIYAICVQYKLYNFNFDIFWFVFFPISFCNVLKYNSGIQSLIRKFVPSFLSRSVSWVLVIYWCQHKFLGGVVWNIKELENIIKHIIIFTQNPFSSVELPGFGWFK